MNIVISVFLIFFTSIAHAKCKIKDFRSDWRVIMTFSQLEDNDAEEVAQHGGEISCTVRFDNNGQFVATQDNGCHQSGLNLPYGLVRDGSIQQQPPGAQAATACNFTMTLEFYNKFSDKAQIVTLPDLIPDQSKIGFGSQLLIAQPNNDFWDAGSAWGYKVARK